MKKQEKTKTKKKTAVSKTVKKASEKRVASKKTVKKADVKKVSTKKKTTTAKKPITKKTTTKSTSKKKLTTKKVTKKNTSKKITDTKTTKAVSKKIVNKNVTNKENIKDKKTIKKKVETEKVAKPKKKLAKRTDTNKTNISLTTKLEEPNISVLEQTEPANINVEKKINKETILIGIIIGLVLLLAISLFALFRSGAELLHFGSTIEEEIVRELPKEADPIYKETWKEFHDKAFVPDDYIGQIVFESEIINEPVLQGDTNETYIRRNYETYKYEICGPVFMDYICNVETDQNLILYGHNRSTSVDPEHVMMFSPLHVLEKQENYDANKVIYMVYEDRLDIYLVASVYPVKVVEKEDGNQYLVKGEPLYYLNNYSPDQFDTYYKTIKQKQFYDTGVELVDTDKLLTLQTCYENNLDKLIVLAKKIGTVNYKES